MNKGLIALASALLILAPTVPAQAKVEKVNICHATHSDSHPYSFVSVAKNSAAYKGHLLHDEDRIDGRDGSIKSKADCPKPIVVTETPTPTLTTETSTPDPTITITESVITSTVTTSVPTETESVTTTSTVTETDTKTSVVTFGPTVPSTSGTPNKPGEPLAHTGNTTLPLIGLALGLLLVGGMLVRYSRLPRRH